MINSYITKNAERASFRDVPETCPTVDAEMTRAYNAITRDHVTVEFDRLIEDSLNYIVNEIKQRCTIPLREALCIAHEGRLTAEQSTEEHEETIKELREQIAMLEREAAAS